MLCNDSMTSRKLKKFLGEDIIRSVVGDAGVLSELEREWEQLQEDRLALRQIFPSGDNKVMLLSRILAPINSCQIHHLIR